VNTSTFKITLMLACALLPLLLLSSCWYTKQATYFLAERARSVPVNRVAKIPETTDAVLAMLRKVDEIRAFAVDELGLSSSRNYTRYVTMDKDYVADVVQACAADSFTRHYWKYPVVGALPYKGFYEKADADQEARRLKSAGLDVLVRKVDAFSSLGYFIDPLYSFMAQYDEGDLAELIIHESAHAALFIRGADQFNEEFATFIGRQGAEEYLSKRYGQESAPLTKKKDDRVDSETFVAFLKETARLLDIVYSDESLSAVDKVSRKSGIISRRATLFTQTSKTLFKNDRYGSFDMATINNAFIDMYRLYEEDLSLYYGWFEKVADRSIKIFVSSLIELAKTSGKGIKEAMIKRLASSQ
jgi:predicted aminopeptidase